MRQLGPVRFALVIPLGRDSINADELVRDSTETLIPPGLAHQPRDHTFADDLPPELPIELKVSAAIQGTNAFGRNYFR